MLGYLFGNIIANIAAVTLVINLFAQGITSYSKGEYENAAGKFSEIINQKEASKYTDDAMYWRGMCNIKLKKNQEALLDFETMQSRFPESDYYNEAEIEITKLHKWDEKGCMDLSNPAYTWKTFLRMLKENDYQRAYDCFEVETRKMLFDDYEEFTKAMKMKIKDFSAVRIQKIKISGVFAGITFTGGNEDEIYLKNTNGKWLFVDSMPALDGDKK